ncbi:hypothetical protein HPB52_023234 [Rhipicephalus sanguineus]|uniref:PiggyBac transposable element-derived protein domain-containing protein n=1 Tax=Rhipicephalus sanguineus TaxID=34632 RepID=A0A9D4T675_RHISA|nr:hypothetical protein HPB52_023234 [Rhipicephalus sanguineus]
MIKLTSAGRRQRRGDVLSQRASVTRGRSGRHSEHLNAGTSRQRAQCETRPPRSAIASYALSPTALRNREGQFANKPPGGPPSYFQNGANLKKRAAARHESYRRQAAAVFAHLHQYYRISIKTKKWTLKVSLHMVDLSIVNAWMQYRKDCSRNGAQRLDTMDLLHFRLAIGEALCASPKRSRSDNGELLCLPDAHVDKAIRVGKIPGVDIRIDGFDHFPTMLQAARVPIKKPHTLHQVNAT